MKPTKRRNNAKLIASVKFTNGSYINVCELNQQYARGGKYIVVENTDSPFCSNGIFKTLNEAMDKFRYMKEGYTYNNILEEYYVK